MREYEDVGFFMETRRGTGTLLLPHAHRQTLEFIEVMQGVADITVGVQTYRVAAGGILHLSPGFVHYASAVSGECLLRTLTYPRAAVLAMDKLDSDIFTMFLLRPQTWSVLFTAGHPLHRTLAAHMETATAEWMGKEIFYATLVFAEISHMIAAILRYYGYGQEEGSERRSIMRIRPVLEYIDTAYSRRIPLSELAGRMLLSSDHFGMLFHEALGMTPIEYINTVRVNRAMCMLVEGNAPVAQIAGACGFSDARYFYKVFRDKCALSPTALRKLRTQTGCGETV